MRQSQIQHILVIYPQMEENFQKSISNILTDHKLLPLSKFKSNKLYTNNIFPDAKQLPEFFQSNLQNSCRVVKQLSGSIGILRIFYYQLLKLGFEIQSPKQDYSVVIKKIFFDERIIQNASSPISGKQYSALQYLRVIAEGIVQLQKQVIPNVEMTISMYPIIDEAILSLLQIIIQKNCMDNVSKEGSSNGGRNEKVFTISQLLTKLCEIFEISLQIYGDCYSFEQSDVFMFAQSIEKVYMAYLSEMAQIESAERTSQTHTISKGTINNQQFIDGNWHPENSRFRLSAGNINKNRKNQTESLLNAVTRKSAGSKRQTQNIVHKNVFQNSSSSDFQSCSPEYSDVFYNMVEDKPNNNILTNLDDNLDPQFAQSQIILNAQYANTSSQNNASEQASLVQYKVQVLSKLEKQQKNKQEEQFNEYGFKNSYKNESHARRQKIMREYQGYGNLYPKKDRIFEEVGPMIIQPRKDRLKNMINNKIEQNKNIAKSIFYRQNTTESIEGGQKDQEKPVPQLSLNQIKLEQLQQKKLEKNHLHPTQNLLPNTKRTEQSIESEQIELFHPHRHHKLISPKKINFDIHQHEIPKVEILDRMRNFTKKEEKNGDQTLGTFYREFTNTKVMQAMNQPYKTRVRMTRQHFRGIRSKNFMGLPFLK